MHESRNQGYPEIRPPVPFYADLTGKVVGLLAPGRHRFVVNQEWTAPTLLDFDVPPQGLTTVATILPRDFPGWQGRPPENCNAALRTKDGDRYPTLLDVTVTNNTDQPYTLTATDLSLFDFIYRVFPPGSQSHKRGSCPGKRARPVIRDTRLDRYYGRGLWCSVRWKLWNSREVLMVRACVSQTAYRGIVLWFHQRK